MKLESVGILISMQPFGERDSIARIFTRDYGVLAGMLRGAQVAKKNKPLTGQVGSLSWNARLDSQLGVFHWEASRNLAAPLMSDVGALSFMNSAFALLVALLPEREKYDALWSRTNDMLDSLVLPTTDSKLSTPPRGGVGLPVSGVYSPPGGSRRAKRCGGGQQSINYLSWEIDLLRELGYALDLTRCSNGYNGEHATSINNHGNPTIEDMLIVGESIRIPQKRGREIILNIKEKCSGIALV